MVDALHLQFFDGRAAKEKLASSGGSAVHAVTSVGVNYMASIMSLSPSGVAIKRTWVGLPCTSAGSGFSLVR